MYRTHAQIPLLIKFAHIIIFGTYKLFCFILQYGSWNDLLLSFFSWVVIVKPVGRCVACNILYFTLDTRNFQLLYHGLIIFVHYGWSYSCRNTDPSASGEFFFMFFMTVFMVFSPIGVFLYQMKMKPACRWQWGKTDRNSSFRLVASQISFEQRDGTPSLILCGKHFGGDRGLVWFSR